MLQWAGVGVAMGQAPQGVKDVADIVTDSVYARTAPCSCCRRCCAEPASSGPVQLVRGATSRITLPRCPPVVQHLVGRGGLLEGEARMDRDRQGAVRQQRPGQGLGGLEDLALLLGAPGAQRGADDPSPLAHEHPDRQLAVRTAEGADDDQAAVLPQHPHVVREGRAAHDVEDDVGAAGLVHRLQEVGGATVPGHVRPEVAHLVDPAPRSRRW